ncbi:MAG: 16S rRNA (uracil(1498)-N(3))-methyltransferase [Sphingomonadaceae bacterium]|nr:16S rRNA (uracil(1498)-N(3))-methyltransferase [Sphingomonadaceae bacterium]
MPATPAWPPRSLPRLFVDAELSAEAEIALDAAQANYLIRVLRLGPGDQAKLFDDRSGEWLAEIAHVGKRDAVLRVVGHLREREAVPDLWLCAAPIKRARWDWVAEKATELGVARLIPVRTARTVVDRVKDDRLRAHMIEAAEQCERTALPELAAMTSLDALLADWPETRHLFFADERGGGSFRKALAAHDGRAAILIGPEGGFTDAENAAIRALPASVPVSLGPRILRADTAAVAAVALWMAGRGDWSGA